MKMSKQVSPMLKCGHAANATDQNGKPCCAICDNDEIVKTPDFTGRMAKCTYCGNTKPSHPDLAFFKHQPDKEKDVYYCGCFGWN